MVNKRDYTSIFITEAQEHLTKLDNGLVELEKQPGSLEIVKELNRQAHTLKGAAGILGFHEIQKIAHRIEDVFDRISQKRLEFNSSIAERIFKGLDAIRAILEKISRDERIDIDVSDICKAMEIISLNETLQQETEKKADSLKPIAPSQGPQAQEPEKEAPEPEIGKPAQEQEARTAFVHVEAAQRQEKIVDEYIRVPLGRVNKLLNLGGEMVINKMKSSQKIIQAKKLSQLSIEAQKVLSDLSDTIKTKFNLDDIEIKKLIGQCNSDIQKLRENSLDLYDNLTIESLHLDRVIDELQASMKEMRMLPCSTIFEGFPRMVRDIASKEGKEVNLEIKGEETELDKKVLEGIKSSLMHILRNCIDHGIEMPGRRESLGKPKIGSIKLSAFHEGGNVLITVEDDGKGIDIEEVRQTALRKRFISKEELGVMSEREALNIIFMNGYSTSPIITDVSGRGIGLDIVRRDIESLKGQVILKTEKDKGSKFTLVMPLTIAIIQVLLVKTQGMLFAIPASSIEETLRIKVDGVSTVGGRMAIQVREHSIPVVKLSEVLSLPHAVTDSGKRESKEEFSVVIVNSLEKRVGFIVDEIVSDEEIFIKGLGNHLNKVKNVSGATILGTGEVIVILDVTDLIDSSRLSHPAVADRKSMLKEARKSKRLLVVEDSFSTRELEKSILETQGYEVDTAVDGLDGLDKLTKKHYDAIVSDVQMPRMDGFEFCKTVKQSNEYKDIPVVIVTALAKEEDKRQGIEAGAAAYIVKSAFDQTNLLDTVGRLI